MNHMKFESPDMTAQNIDRIAALFPNCVTEALDEERSTPEKKVYKRAINFEMLKQAQSIHHRHFNVGNYNVREIITTKLQCV